ncbi:MAG TPA: sigma-70 family RNA polymerase sigma factor, partial [Isosphaeraceae bacterium]|nr:sigma-70 family RNA polymerase sigma factor [Isosphaeraceae bacterium]
MPAQTSAPICRAGSVSSSRPGLAALSDRELLRRFTRERTEVAEAAFDVLLARHGAMVWAVCRHLLRNSHDASDAFQGTFLVLVRKADTVRVEGSLGNWLYGVACRVALRTRSDVVRRRSIEGLVATRAAVASQSPSLFDDLRPVIHEELIKLPAKYRAPVVLCYMEGLTHGEASAKLGWPLGTVKGRLARARDLLRGRLTRRGLACSAPVLMAALKPKAATAAIEPALRSSVLREAARHVAIGRLATTTVGHAAATFSQDGLSGWLFAGGKLAAAALVTTVAIATAGLSRPEADGETQPALAQQNILST